jgi:hypothetical protein
MTKTQRMRERKERIKRSKIMTRTMKAMEVAMNRIPLRLAFILFFRIRPLFTHVSFSAFE